MEHPTYHAVCRALESMATELAALEEELRMANDPAVHDPAFLDTVTELIADRGADALRWGREIEEPTRRGLRALALQCMVTLAFTNPVYQMGVCTTEDAWGAEIAVLSLQAKNGLLG